MSKAIDIILWGLMFSMILIMRGQGLITRGDFLIAIILMVILAKLNQKL